MFKPQSAAFICLHWSLPAHSVTAFEQAYTIKNLPAMQETRVQSLGRNDPLQKGMATHFSILAWRIPWTAEPGGLQSMGSQRVRTTEQLTPSFSHQFPFKTFEKRPEIFVCVPAAEVLKPIIRFFFTSKGPCL